MEELLLEHICFSYLLNVLIFDSGSIPLYSLFVNTEEGVFMRSNIITKRVLNYPGSKWNISEEIAFMIPKHKCYVEPFFGSGAVFFSKPYISPVETINDLNSDVTNLFRCIQKDSDRLARMVAATPYSRDEYNAAFVGAPEDCFEQALRFLIKCWQGMGYRANGDVVGWKCDANGREKMYAVWNWFNLPNDIIEVCERLRAVQIENCNALDLIQRYDDPNTFMYLDPPYLFMSGMHKEYVHGMDEKDHAILLEKITKCKSKIMISGYETDLYNDYLTDWKKTTFSTNCNGGSTRKECVWMNFCDGQMSIFDLKG